MVVSASAADVKENWEKSCAKCHGADGKGDTKMGKKLEIKDFTDAKYQASLKDDAMFKAIQKRGAKLGDGTPPQAKAKPRLTAYGGVGDTWFVQCEGLTHVYYNGDGGYGHATSQDLIHWQRQPTALRSGPRGSYDDGELWSGCAVENQGLIHLFYCNTTRRDGRLRQGMSLANSKDGGRTFEKYAGNPLIEPDPKWYYTINDPVPPFGYHGAPMIDCRDMIVVRNPLGGWFGYVVNRRKGTNAFD